MKILSFDIEDWFHILDNKETESEKEWLTFPSRIEIGVDRILQLLNDTNQTATFFCLGWIAEKYPNVIKSIVCNGHHLATHSYSHQLAYNQTRIEFEEDLNRSIDVLQQISGKKIDTYRAPGFSIKSKNFWVFELLAKNGILNDCSIFPANRAHGGIPDYEVAYPSLIEYQNTKIKSFPINTTKFLGKEFIYSGGGYFRLLPLWYLKRNFLKDDYIMTYFHPRDFDPKQPIAPGLDFVRKFKSYVGLNSAYPKLESLLKEHQFMSVDMAINVINWNSVEKIILDKR